MAETARPLENKPRIWLYLVLGAGLIACLAWLVVAFYQSQISLQKQLIKDFRKEMAIRSGALGYFFHERLNDLQNMAESQGISSYFTNKALGMTMEYGLKASLVQVERELNKWAEEKKIEGEPIYQSLFLIDLEGRPLGKSGRSAPTIQDELGDFLQAGRGLVSPEITVTEGESGKMVVGLAPVVFKSRPVGMVMAVVDACTMFRQITGNIDHRVQGVTHLVSELQGRLIHLCCNSHNDNPGLPGRPSSEPERLPSKSALDRNARRLDLVLSIKGTPLNLLIDAPLDHIYGSMPTQWILVFLAGLIFVLLAGLAFLLRTELRASALRKRFAEEEKTKRVQLEKMTAKLDHEIRERTQAQVSSLRKNELLEGVREVLTDALDSTSIAQVAMSSLMVAQKMTRSRFGFLGTCDQEKRFQVLAMSHPGWGGSGIDGSKAIEVLDGAALEGLMAEAYSTGQSQIANDINDDPVFGIDSETGLNVSSVLVVPLKRDDRSFGILVLTEKEGGFSGYDIEAVEDLSTSLVAAFRQKETEESLRISEEQNRTLVESITEGLLVVDKNLKLTFVNDSLIDLLGYEREEAESRELMDFFDDDNKLILRQQWERRKMGEQEPYEIVFTSKNGSKIHTMIYPKAFINDTGEFMGAIALVVDLSQRKSKEAQVLQAQKLEAIGQLAAGIAHEINTPTNFVANNVRFFKDNLENIISLLESYHELKIRVEEGGPTAETVDKIADIMESADLEFVLEELPVALDETLEGLDHIADIVRSMKEFAHPGSDDKIPYNINEGLKNTATVSKNEWKYVSNLEFDLEDDLPFVLCVPSQINQVFLNIIVNAAHAIAETAPADSASLGRITISTRNLGDKVEIRIADTGPGIPEVIRERIFEPFFTTKSPGKGTGQGLAIAHSIIVDNHGGSIAVESDPGHGSVFIITLPTEPNEGD